MYIYVTQPSAFLPCSSNATQRFVVCRVTVTLFQCEKSICEINTSFKATATI